MISGRTWHSHKHAEKAKGGKALCTQGCDTQTPLSGLDDSLGIDKHGMQNSIAAVYGRPWRQHYETGILLYGLLPSLGWQRGQSFSHVIGCPDIKEIWSNLLGYGAQPAGYFQLLALLQHQS